MALEVPLFLQPSTGDPAIPYTAQQSRVMFDIMSFLPGVTLKNDLAVSQRGAGANLSVDVAPGSAVVPGTSIAYQGKYLVRSTAVVNVPLVGGVPGTGTRTDLIVAQVQDNQADGSGFYDWTPVWVPGTTTAPDNSIPLAKVTVTSGAVSIVNANIDGTPRLLNTLGDVPMFEVSGGNGMAVPSLDDTIIYSGWTVSDSIGMRSVTSSGGATVNLPGRYIVSFSSRIDTNGASSQREVILKQFRSGTLVRRAANQVTSKADGTVQGKPPMSVTRTFRCNAGDVLQAFFWQNSGVTLHVDDEFAETAFTGVWVGP